ncbi:MAG: hypothetical protein ACI9XO_003794 [Paraglaciecola sp.]|jgi:hypothetical protein
MELNSNENKFKKSLHVSINGGNFAPALEVKQFIIERIAIRQWLVIQKKMKNN